MSVRSFGKGRLTTFNHHNMQNAYYEFTVPVFVRSLENLRAILVKAKDFAKEKGLDDAKLLDSRLAPDMFPLVKQVQVATDNAKGAVARLTGSENPKYQDDETTVDELLARIDKTLTYVKSFKAEDFAGAAERKVSLPWMPEGSYFDADTYLRDFLVGNFYFHFVTAYGILRNLGMNIGKQDFTGELEMKKD